MWASPANGQSRGYELLPSPDLWYNDVDGIRLGLNVKGQVPGSFDDGPHRLDAGFWVGLWFPDNPVSYYVTLTEPIRPWSDFGSEANLQFLSSIRAGYQKHGISLNKRWQTGFDERRFYQISLHQHYENRMALEYTAFPALWTEEDKWVGGVSLEIQRSNRLGWYNIDTNLNTQYLNDFFAVWTATAIQNVPINDIWGGRIRLFSGIASADSAPEYLFSRSTMPAINTLESGVTRAKGTIPNPWMQSGNFHLAGGANIRGYMNQDVESFTSDEGEPAPILQYSFISANIEFDYWNPFQSLIKESSMISDFLSLRSYLFFDTGRSLQINSADSGELFSDAGTGLALSFNIPNNFGKPRGFVLRYELPLWLSHPKQGDDKFSFRQIVGFGAVISF
jgi:hypothetical protein